MLGYAAGVGPGTMRDLVCEVLLKRPDQNNWLTLSGKCVRLE
jgi:hypothetical protein